MCMFHSIKPDSPLEIRCSRGLVRHPMHRIEVACTSKGRQEGLRRHPSDQVAQICRSVGRNTSKVDVGLHNALLVIPGDGLQGGLEVVGRLAVPHSPVCVPSKSASNSDRGESLHIR